MFIEGPTEDEHIAQWVEIVCISCMYLSPSKNKANIIILIIIIIIVIKSAHLCGYLPRTKTENLSTRMGFATLKSKH